MRRWPLIVGMLAGLASGVAFSQVAFDGAILTKGSSGSNGSLTDGGVVKGNLQVDGNSIFDGGSFQNQLTVQGTTTFTGGVVIGSGGGTWSGNAKLAETTTNNGATNPGCIQWLNVTGLSAENGNACMLAMAANISGTWTSCYWHAGTGTALVCVLQSQVTVGSQATTWWGLQP